MNIPLSNKKRFNRESGITERISRLRRKKCARKGCNNYIEDRGNDKRFCIDPKCVAMRDMDISRPKKKRKDYNLHPQTINVIIPKQQKLIGKTLNICCYAKDKYGIRCNNYIYVPYSINRTVYPRYCKDHSNEFKRERFAMGNKRNLCVTKITNTDRSCSE